MPEPLFVVCWVPGPGREVNDVSLFSTRERALDAVKARVRLSDPRLGVVFSQGCYVRTDGMPAAYLLRKEVDEGRAEAPEEPTTAPEAEGEGILSSKEKIARHGGDCHACGERFESGAPIVLVTLYQVADRTQQRIVRCHQACPGKG